MPIRVLIVDPHEIIRAGIKHTCSDRNDLKCVGEASSLAEARQIAQETSPDVLILDPDCAAHDGEALDEIRRFHQEMPNVKVLVFTANDDSEHAVHVVEAGASGYLIKAAGMDEIAVAIRALHIGRVFISHSHPKLLPPAHATKQVESRTALDCDGADAGLSEREQEVLAMLGDGMTNKQVAEALFLSVKTVETYRARIMKKHNLRDRAELVQLARRTMAAT